MIDTVLQQDDKCCLLCTVMTSTGPIEMEEADLSALSPTLPTPDVERRDVNVLERTKRDGPGMHVSIF